MNVPLYGVHLYIWNMTNNFDKTLHENILSSNRIAVKLFDFCKFITWFSMQCYNSVRILINSKQRFFSVRISFSVQNQKRDSLTEWSKMLVLGISRIPSAVKRFLRSKMLILGTSPKGRGFKSHSCQKIFNRKILSKNKIYLHH